MSQTTEIKSNSRDFHPSGKLLIISTLVWAISSFLLVLATTDLFRESFFQSKYLMIYLIMLSSTVTVVKLYHDYFKKKD